MRIEKKKNLRILGLEKCKDREKYRIYGELIKANLYMIENGIKNIEIRPSAVYDDREKSSIIYVSPSYSTRWGDVMSVKERFDLTDYARKKQKKCCTAFTRENSCKTGFEG